MQLLKQPLTHGEDYINKFAADLATRATNTHCGVTWSYSNIEKVKPKFTTLALLIKRILLDFLNGKRIEYNIGQVIDMANEITELSGRGSSKHEYSEINDRTLCKWSWAIVKGFADAVKKSEDIKMTKILWTRCQDGSAQMDMGYDRCFLIETPDIHDSWAHNDYGVIEKWYAKEDKRHHYFNYKVFPTEYEARLFIADLVMKINSSWCSSLEKATNDITDEMAKIYVSEQKLVDKEIDDRELGGKGEELKKEYRQRVYIMNFVDGINKIGVSSNIETRAKTKEKESGRIVNKICATDFLPSSQAYAIESSCHYALSEYRTAGEFFNCSYEQAQAVLKCHSPITVQLDYHNKTNKFV